MTIMRAKNRSLLVSFLTSIIDQLPKLLPSVSVLVDGTMMTQAQMVALFKAHLIAMAATDATRNQLKDDVAAEQKTYAQVKAALASLRAYAVSMLGSQSAAFATLGFTAKKRAVLSAAEKAAAAVKGAATRVVRHTMGSKQKKAVHAAAPAAPVPATPATPATGSGH